MAKPFKGRIELNIRDATPDWDAFLPDNADDAYVDVERELAAAIAHD